MGNKEYLEMLRSSAIQRKDDFVLTILCNVDGQTCTNDNYSKDSITSEFLTISQLNAMLSAFRSSGFETNSYVDEDIFMRDVLNGTFYRAPGKYNIVFNSAQKGTSIGRKSLIPAFCDLHGIYHNNSNAYIVSLCRDKFFSGELIKSLGFPCPNSWLYRPNMGWLLGKRPAAGKKVIAKLNYETSSIGLKQENIFTYSPEQDSFISALSKAYQQDIIVQEFIPGYEVEIPVIIDKRAFSVAPMGIYYHNSDPLGLTILDYEGRKNHTYHFRDFRHVSPLTAKKMEDIAVNAALALGIKGLGRIDFRVTEDDFTPYITDIATNPGIHKNSSAFQSFQDLGYEYPDMMTILLGLVLSRYQAI